MKEREKKSVATHVERWETEIRVVGNIFDRSTGERHTN